MNKAEFIQTLSGYVPEKLIDTLAENAEWDGLFYEGNESKPDKQASDQDLNIVPFMTSDIENRGHRQKCQRTFKEFRAKIKDEVKNLSAKNNAPVKPEALEDSSNSSEIDIDFIPDSDNSEIKTLVKEQANRRRRVYEQLHRS